MSKSVKKFGEGVRRWLVLYETSTAFHTHGFQTHAEAVEFVSHLHRAGIACELFARKDILGELMNIRLEALGHKS